MENIVENNRLIAEFMDVQLYGILETGGNPLRAVYGIKEAKKYERKGYKTQMAYHSSWDWLMPVVEKIESIPMSVNIYRDNCNIYNKEGDRVGLGTYNKGKIYSVWTAAVEFIKWYNKQQNPLK